MEQRRTISLSYVRNCPAKGEHLLYTPPHYSTTGSPYKTVYFNDGKRVIDSPLLDALDNMIASGDLPPMIAVCMPNGTPGNTFGSLRRLEYTGGIPDPEWAKKAVAVNDLPAYYVDLPKVYGEMIRDDIIPYVEKNYHVGKDRTDRAIAGGSYGGTYTCYYANNFSDVIANFCVYNGFEFQMPWKGIDNPIRVAVVAGWFDEVHCQDGEAFRKSVVDVFGKDTKAKITVSIYNGGHEHVTRLPELPAAVRFFWGMETKASGPGVGRQDR